MESSTAALLSDIRAKNRVFRKACAQVVLLNLRIEDAKTHYLRARATGNLAFRYSYRMKLTSLEGVRDALYDFAVVKCEEIEALQTRLHEVTGAVFYIVADEDSSDEDWSVVMAHCVSSLSQPSFWTDVRYRRLVRLFTCRYSCWHHPRFVMVSYLYKVLRFTPCILCMSSARTSRYDYVYMCLCSPLFLQIVSNKRLFMLKLKLVLFLFNSHSHTLKTKNCHDANFFVTVGTGFCPNDNLRCHQWRQSWHYDISWFAVHGKYV